MLTNEQVVSLAKELIINQGNMFDEAEKMFGQLETLSCGKISDMLENVGKIWLCPYCDTWVDVTNRVNRHYDVCFECSNYINTRPLGT